MLISKRENLVIKYCDDSKAFIEFSNDMNDMKILMCTIRIKKRKILILFDDIVADMLSNKKLQPTVT